MSTCATASRALAEPLAGTAATARTWLLIEQPGPWGKKALTQSHLDPELGQTLDAAASAHGGRVALIRRPGRHADNSSTARHRIFLARTVPGNSWVRTVALSGDDLGELRKLDFAALDGASTGVHGASAGVDGATTDTAGVPPLGFGWEPYRGDPLALVCTNGKRDRCCALLGRPLAAELEASGGANVWEITHIGGHRFAPTLLVLPYGYAYGRLDAPAVKGVLDAVRDGHVLTDGCRGRSAWDRPGQAADLAVRERTGESGAHALTVTAVREEPAKPRQPDADQRRWRVTVAHVDGRRWHVLLAESADGPALPASCGAAPAAPVRMEALRIEEPPARP